MAEQVAALTILTWLSEEGWYTCVCPQMDMHTLDPTAEGALAKMMKAVRHKAAEDPSFLKRQHKTSVSVMKFDTSTGKEVT